MHAEELAKTIDHTLLQPNATQPDVERLCDEAADYHFAAVCVLPHWVPLAGRLLADSDVKVCTVVGFPFGADGVRSKVAAAKEAVAHGADEIDVVIYLPAMLSGDFTYVRDELTRVVRAVRMAGVNNGRGQVIVKVDRRDLLPVQQAQEAGLQDRREAPASTSSRPRPGSVPKAPRSTTSSCCATRSTSGWPSRRRAASAPTTTSSA